MLNIDYTGLFYEENIQTFLGQKTYQEGIAIWNTLYDYYKDYTPQKFDNEEFIDLKLLISISLKYGYNKNKVKDLIYRMMLELQSIRFHMRKLYFKLLPSKEEKESWLDECIEYYKSNHDYQNLCKFLDFFINDTNNINRSKYKEIYADACMEIALNSEGLVACCWYEKVLPLYKQLNLKEKYNGALRKYNENIEITKNGFHEIELKMDNPVLQNAIFEQRKTIYEFFKNQLETVHEKLSALCSRLYFKDFGNFPYEYMPFFPKYENDIFETSLVDMCHNITFSGNKIVKTVEGKDRYDWIGRELIREMSIIPAVQGFLHGITNAEEIETEILNHSLILENDQRHIKRAIKAFIEKDYDGFIYIIIPNFEKLLRNVLVLNRIPDYVNKDTETQYQTTLTLTETIKRIKEHNLLHPYVIEKISQELNEENYENYRNKLSHREDDTIFTQTVAFDLFLLLIQLLKNFENKEELFTFLITKADNNNVTL